ncbi:MAG: alkaline phosphatase D family protein [Hyphomonadaceae bacterium]
MTQKHISRRTALSLGAMLSASACTTAASPGLGRLGSAAPDRKNGVFTHGVASGDPFPESVVLWTRFVPADGGRANLGWEVAEDEAFERIVAAGETAAGPDTDYCAKTIAGTLKPGARYWYRFNSLSGVSIAGRTRTAPARDHQADLTLALFACSNLPTGWFNAYAHAACDPDIDLCVHVGDYFYEYAMDRYGADALPGRTVDPFECVTLPQYYSRYATYRSDPDLQELHRQKPWVMTWDDHDFANDAWMGGAQNHQPETEGPWETRKAAAIKAFRDWTPTRASSSKVGLLHRTLSWGRLADLIVLDSRMVGRTNQMDWRPVLFPALDQSDDAFSRIAWDYYNGPMSDPRRTILGADQEAWFADRLGDSAARDIPWQIVIEGSVLGAAVAPPDSDETLAQTASEGERKMAHMRARLGAAGLPYDLPLWCGYPEARRRFLDICARHGRNVLALGGETHAGWAFNLPGGKDGRPACVEAAAFAVASSGKARGGALIKGERESAYRASSPEIGWCNLAECGYTRIHVTETQSAADWIGFNDLTNRDCPPTSVERTVSEATQAHGASAWSPA